jgi:predicted small integral membrane protein
MNQFPQITSELQANKKKWVEFMSTGFWGIIIVVAVISFHFGVGYLGIYIFKQGK